MLDESIFCLNSKGGNISSDISIKQIDPRLRLQQQWMFEGNGVGGSTAVVQISLSRKLISERSVGTRRARQSMNGAIRLAGWSSTVGKYRILQRGK